MVALPYTQGGQAARNMNGLGAQFPVAPGAAILEHGERPVRMLRGATFDKLAQNDIFTGRWIWNVQRQMIASLLPDIGRRSRTAAPPKRWGGPVNALLTVGLGVDLAPDFPPQQITECLGIGLGNPRCQLLPLLDECQKPIRLGLRVLDASGALSLFDAGLDVGSDEGL